MKVRICTAIVGIIAVLVLVWLEAGHSQRPVLRRALSHFVNIPG